MAKIRVPQKSGDITIARNGDDPVVYKVSSGSVEVPDDAALHFLAVVDGSQVVGGQAAEAKLASDEKE